MRITRRQVDELRSKMDMIEDNLQDLRRTLRDLDEEPVKRFSRFEVHVSRIADDMDKSVLLNHLEEMYGQITSSKRGPFWMNVEFKTTESQERCLADNKELYERFGIAVKRRIMQ